jgi:cytochrome c peroxidase
MHVSMSQRTLTRIVQGIGGLAAALVLGWISTNQTKAGALGKALEADQPQSALIAFGQQLFNDPHLSADGSVSCASCHMPTKAFSDGRPVAIGVRRQAGTRNTPSLADIGQSPDVYFFWDGRRTHLEQAVMDPFTNPAEMGLHDDQSLLEKLQQNPAYKNRFNHSNAKEASTQQLSEIAQALTVYLRSLDHRTSAYDRYASKRDATALSYTARRGLAVFAGKGRCVQCHQMEGNPTAFTDQAFHHTGVGLNEVAEDLPRLTQGIIARSLQGAALGNRVATHADEAQLGRFNVTHNVADIGLFRTPSLRGVALTAPYMHDGSVPTLEEAVDQEIYYRSLTSGHPIGLTVEEKNDLLAFLQAL